MANQVFVFFLSLALLCRLCWPSLQSSHSQTGSRRTLVQRLLKPRTPLDCPICRLSSSGVKPSSSARRHTPLYRLKTPSQQVSMVLSALAEGLDPSAAERVFGYRQATIITWLTRAGEHAQIVQSPKC